MFRFRCARAAPFALAAVLALPLLAGCTGQGITPRPTAALEGFAEWSDALPPYRLGPGDRVRVVYLLTPEMDEEVAVRPDGALSIRTAGTVAALDRTPEEVADTIALQASRLLREPMVTVQVVEPASARVFVGGEVRQPSAYTISGTMDALQAVIEAGGFTREARLDQVVLIRRGPGDRPMLRTLDLRRYVETGGFASTVALVPGDIVYVPKSRIAEVNLWIEQFIEKVVPFQRTFSYSVNRGTLTN